MTATAAMEAAGGGLDSAGAFKIMSSLKTHNASLQAQLQELQVGVCIAAYVFDTYTCFLPVHV